LESKKQHSSDALAWLEKHGDYLFRFALSRVRDRETAEDLVQDTLLAALKSADSFSEKSSRKTWLASILKHKIIDHFRKSKREVYPEDDANFDHLMQTAFHDNGSWRVGPEKWSYDPSTLFERGEFWIFFKTCLEYLPSRHATAFQLREIDGLNGNEICKVLDLSTTNLGVILHRARLSLRKCLEENFFEKGRDANA
jgi:RNA polymerase sigma-70 factor (TIGR02943 family)